MNGRSVFHFFLIFVIIILSGCGEDKKYKIGVSQCSQDDWREKMNEEIKREIMFHEDAEVEIRSADDSSKKQIEDLRYFKENGFDIIIVSPNEAAELTPVIKDIYESGIPVVIFDRNINGDSFTARIGADDVGLGKSAANYSMHLLKGKRDAFEIFGLRGSTPAEDRHKGFTEAFTANGGRVLASASANWNKEDAVIVVDSLLNIYPEVDLIFAHNDRMAIGASEVIKKRGLKDVKIIGIDAAPNIGIKAVSDSVIDATFLYPTEGHRIIRTALNILKGEKFLREQILPVSSAVDKSNADILLLQDETLKVETEKMSILKNRIDEYWSKHASQTSLFYASIVIIVLMIGVVFLILRSFWQNKRHQESLLHQYKLLEEERDKQKILNDKLQEATQSKLMFFTNVSHDLRTPLTLISEPVAQMTGADNLTSQQKTLMKIADKNVRILKRLINQILDFRKYENDKLKLNLSEINFGKTLEEWIEAFYSLAKKRNMKLSLIKPDDDPEIILALDPEKFERVIFNLISNAFKYTPDNGSITITYKVDSGNLVLSVADTGEGISQRDLGNIFDRFFQVERVHPNGSGIGLSLSKAFIELHGGEISVESTLKKGSVFTVVIPIRHVDNDVVTVARKISVEDVTSELDIIESDVKFNEEKPIILVIDDNRDIQKLVTQLLNDRYNIITASNGKDGLKMATKYVPDLIICDVMMPVMDGLECCRLIKEEVTTSHIPVLMLTACSLDEQRVQGFDCGADGYLPKPFNSAVLLAQCASLIKNRKRIKEIWSRNNILPNGQTGKKDNENKKKVRELPSTDIDNEFYKRFLDIFYKEMGNLDLSVDKIAGMMGFERTQFYRKIKALTNYSPVELIRNLRLKQARTLLLQTEKSISEIAYDTGFSTPAYFSKCFRDAFGETPSDLRNKTSK